MTTSAGFQRHVSFDPALSGGFPFRINVKGLSREALKSLRFKEVQSVVQSLENIEGIHLTHEQQSRIVQLFQNMEPSLSNHLKSPYFKTLVGESVVSRVKRLQ